MEEVEKREQAAKARRLAAALDRVSFGCASLDLMSRSRTQALNDAHVVTLAAALNSNATVTECNLESNCITDDGAAALGTFLGSNTTLTTLNLSKNLIGRSGLALLERVLRETNTTLTHLDVSSMWESGAEAGWAGKDAKRLHYVDTRIEGHLRRNRKIQAELPTRFPCSVRAFQSTILRGALPPPPAEAAAWRVDDELFDELFDDEPSGDDDAGDGGGGGGGGGSDNSGGGDGSSNYPAGGCVLQRLNGNGAHFATHFKQLIADFAGVRYRSAVRKWSAARRREEPDEGGISSPGEEQESSSASRASDRSTDCGPGDDGQDGHDGHGDDGRDGHGGHGDDGQDGLDGHGDDGGDFQSALAALTTATVQRLVDIREGELRRASFRAAQKKQPPSFST